MANKEYGSSGPGDIVHLPQTFILKGSIADCQHFVHKQHFSLHVSCNGEGEADVHTAGVTLHRRIYKLFNVREGDDLIKLAFNLNFTHAENCTIEKDVFAAGQFGMKACAHL